MTFPEDTKEELAREDAKEWQTRALKAEAHLNVLSELYKHGVNTGHGTLYGREETCKQFLAQIEELREFRWRADREEELRAASAKIDWFEKREALMITLHSWAQDEGPHSDVGAAALEVSAWIEKHPKP